MRYRDNAVFPHVYRENGPKKLNITINSLHKKTIEKEAQSGFWDKPKLTLS